VADDAGRKLVTLTMAGADEHQGHVMARALVEKLDKFLKTFAGFERAYLGVATRQTDFEVVILHHNSPTQIGLNPIPRSRSHIPTPAVVWTLEQWDRIARGEVPDGIVDEDLVDDLAGLAERDDKLGYSSFSISYDEQAIDLNDMAFVNAEKLKLDMRARRPRLPWRAGISAGSLIGELKAVSTEDGDRQIIIVPFYGPGRVLCKFTDDMREQIRSGLFNTVKVSGMMHYGAAGPHPILIEVETIEPFGIADDAPHFIDGAGLFKDGAYPIWLSGNL
jgi:hypothetical protein